MNGELFSGDQEPEWEMVWLEWCLDSPANPCLSLGEGGSPSALPKSLASVLDSSPIYVLLVPYICP